MKCASLPVPSAILSTVMNWGTCAGFPTGWSLLTIPAIPWHPDIFARPHLPLPCRFPRQIHLNCLMDISAVPPAVDSALFTAFGKSALLT